MGSENSISAVCRQTWVQILTPPPTAADAENTNLSETCFFKNVMGTCLQYVITVIMGTLSQYLLHRRLNEIMGGKTYQCSTLSETLKADSFLF